jgi:hypothetical protein
VSLGGAAVPEDPPVQRACRADRPPEASSFWIPAAHALGYQRLGGGGAEEPFRLSAPALVWIRGELTYRLEGLVSRGRALEIARSLDGQ